MVYPLTTVLRKRRMERILRRLDERLCQAMARVVVLHDGPDYLEAVYRFMVLAKRCLDLTNQHGKEDADSRRRTA